MTAIASDTFHFLDPGPLVDRELELIAPAHRWVNDVLSACCQPLTKRIDPQQARTRRQELLDFLKLAPDGLQPGDGVRAASYHFWMRWRDDGIGERPPVHIAGGISLRIGHSEELELYSGHIGYHVYPPARGRHFAERACRLVSGLALRHGMTGLWITCNPDNAASIRTCERLGAELVEVIAIPSNHPFHARGERAKCRYWLGLSGDMAM